MDNLFAAPATMCTSKVTLAAGTTTTLGSTGTILFCIGGYAYSKAALSTTATPTTDWATGNAFIPIPIPGTTTNLPPGVVASSNGYVCAFLVGLDHSGNVKVIQGQIVPLDVSGNPITVPNLPSALGPAGSGSTDNDFCPIGYIEVKLGSTAVATWTFGTNNWGSVTGVTTSFGDLMSVPGRPPASLTFS